jgi:polyisoprenoid-binding protein YceI
MKKLVLSILSLMMIAAMPAQAQTAAPEKYTFDKAHTQIMFFANHLGFSVSEGEFLDFDGHFIFDREKPENSSVDVTIQTASINMDDADWDKSMKSANFFNVEKFPTMTFKGTSIKVTGDNSAEITGDLTLLGVKKPVTLMVKHNKSGTHPYTGKFVAGFSATANINRSDWGMNYGIPGVANDIELRIEAEGIREEVAGTGAADGNH